MKKLNEDGVYEVNSAMKKVISELFYGGYCDDEHTRKTIKKCMDESGYVIDTHTAVAKAVHDEEIKKFKELLDLGVITQEEFDKKKKEVLSL